MNIANEFLRLDLDTKDWQFTLTDVAMGRTVSTSDISPVEPTSATVETARNPAFGTGQQIENGLSDGGAISLELYPMLPFALIRRTLVNQGEGELDLQRYEVSTFTVDLGVPADALRTLGTGGLLHPDENPGSYAFLACAVPESRYGLVAGWLTHDRGSGVLFSNVKDGVVEFQCRIDYGHLRLAPGDSTVLETLAIGVFADARRGLEQYAEAVRRHYNIRLRPRQATYCTWYAEKHGRAGDEKSTVELARFAASELKPFGLGVIQIDDRWQDGPAIDGPPRGFERCRPDGPYPNGIAPVAEQVAALGMTLGLWWLPFGRNHEDPDWSNRQDWFARQADGTPLKTRAFGGTCLDLTHPEVRRHLATLAGRFREWGVTYYKMDGLWTGTATKLTYINDGYVDDDMANVAPFNDRSQTQIEAYRDGLKLLRERAGDDVFFSGCAVSQNMRSFGGSFGLVDAMRIGPDFDHDGQGIKTGPLRASRLYFLNGRVWWNDPDPTMVRPPGRQPKMGDADSLGAGNGGTVKDAAKTGVTLEMARLTTSFSALTGQFFLLSDWLPDLALERLEVLRRTMLSHDADVRPIDYFDNPLPAIWLLSDRRQGVARHVLGLFNWEDDAQEIGASLAKADLDPQQRYHAFDFWENTQLPDIEDAFRYKLPGRSCRIIALRAVENRPVVLSTSRHISQGVVDVVKEEWNDCGTLSGTSRIIANDPYELRIVLPTGWQLQTATADVRLTTTRTDNLLRVNFHSPTTREVSWQLALTNTVQLKLEERRQI